MTEVIGTALRRLMLNLVMGLGFLGAVYLVLILLPDGENAGNAMLMACLPLLVGSSIGGAIRVGWARYQEHQWSQPNDQTGEGDE